MNQSAVFMTSVYDFIAAVTAYIDVMIDNADVYYDSGYWGVRRDTSRTDYTYAHYDTYNIEQAVNKCIDLIYDQDLHK